MYAIQVSLSSKNHPIVHSAVNNGVLVQLKLSPSPTHDLWSSVREILSPPAVKDDARLNHSSYIWAKWRLLSSGAINDPGFILFSCCPDLCLVTAVYLSTWGTPVDLMHLILALICTMHCKALFRQVGFFQIRSNLDTDEDEDSTWMAYMSLTVKGLNTYVKVQFFLLCVVLSVDWKGKKMHNFLFWHEASP